MKTERTPPGGPEDRYRLIAEAMPEFVWLDARDGSAIYANRRWLEYTGATDEANQGFGWLKTAHPDDIRRLEALRERTLQTAEPYEGECRFRGKDGKYRWYLFRSIPVRDEHGTIISWLGTATDIDKQKRAEAQQAFFALASDVLASTLDVSGTLERIARLAVAAIGTWCQIDIPDAQGRLQVAAVAHQNAEHERILAQLLHERVYNESAKAGPPHVVRSLKPQLFSQVDEELVPYVIPDARHRDVYHGIGYASGIIVPLHIRDRVLGCLGIASDDPTRLYTDSDLATAVELGRRAAIALENAQSFEREHRVAATLQAALLPSMLPSGNGVRFSAAYASAASGQGEAVGGDWYDAFPVDGDRIALSIGDVAGHGLNAAVTMSVVRQAIRAAALEHHAPREVLMRANRILALEQRTPMITGFYGVYNTRTREFSYSIAGHPRPLLVDAAGNLTVLDGFGSPLGDAFDEVLLQQQTITLSKGSAVVLYTDGLVEFAHDIIEAEQRLHRALLNGTGLAEKNAAQAIIDAVLDGEQRDDIAVLVMSIQA